VLKAVRRLNLLRGDIVLVAGQGPVGLLFTRLLQLQGVRVLATDLLASRLHLAKKFGAKRAILASQLSTLNAQLDSAIVAVPSDAVVRQALQLVRGGGQVLLFAHTKRERVAGSKLQVAGSKAANLQPSTFNLQLSTICLDEKDLIGSYSSDFTLQREVARLVFSRRLDVRPLISHRFPLAATPEAVRLAANPKPDSLKILVTQQEPTCYADSSRRSVAEAEA
jgi:L-iditol 2-dehydrogenase